MRPDEYERDVGPLTLAYHAGAWQDMVPHIGTLTGLGRAALVAVEIGVRGAVSSWAILDGLPSHGTLHSIDAVDVLVEGIVPRRVRDDPRWRFLVGDSTDVLPTIRAADLVVIDGSHEYADTARELAEAGRMGARTIALHDCYLPGVADAIAEFRDGWRIEYETSAWGLAVLRR